MKKHITKFTKKLVIGIIGGVVTLLGLVMIPYPGPGWLVVFAGLSILASEFSFAHNLLKSLRRKYDLWRTWIARQNWSVKIAIWISLALVLVFTIWIINGYGVISEIFNLDISWLTSPIFR